MGTIRIDDVENGRSHVTWSANMALDPKSADQIATMVTGMYEAGLASLEAYHRDSKAA